MKERKPKSMRRWDFLSQTRYIKLWSDALQCKQKKKSSSISYYCKRTFNRTAGPELITEEWMCMNESEVCVMYISYLILYLSIYLNYLSIYKNQNGTEPMKKKGMSEWWLIPMAPLNQVFNQGHHKS